MNGQRGRNVMSLHEIEGLARQGLSSFTGNENYEGDYYEGVDTYEGMDPFGGDDFVEFDGYNGTNLSAGGIQTFTFTVTNANAAVRTVLLSPGIIPTATGLIKTGAFNDKSGAAGLTGSGAPKPIEYLTEFFRNNPLKITTLQIQSTDPAQVYQTITVRQESPFRDLQTTLINCGSHIGTQDYKDKMVIVPAHQYGLQFDNQTVVELPVIGSSTMTITIYAGPILNTAGALSKKVKKAIAPVRKAAPKRK